MVNHLTARFRNKLPFLAKDKCCPVCDQVFNTYLPLPAHYPDSWKQFGFPFTGTDFETLHVEAFSCPKCGATDRDRLYALYLNDFWVNRAGSKKVLDIAPGAALGGWIRKHLGSDYTSCDLFMEGVDVVADIQDLGVFQDQQFDLIICSHVLEHVPDDQKALKELFRVLRTGGEAVLMVPIVKKLTAVIEDPALTSVPERWKRFGQDDHIRLYSPAGFASRIETAGFQLKKITMNTFQEEIVSAGLDPEGVLYVGRK